MTSTSPLAPRHVQLTKAEIRYLLNCIRSADLDRLRDKPTLCDFYESVVLKLLTRLNYDTEDDQ